MCVLKVLVCHFWVLDSLSVHQSGKRSVSRHAHAHWIKIEIRANDTPSFWFIETDRIVSSTQTFDVRYS